MYVGTLVAHGALLISRAMSAATLCFSTAISAARGKRIRSSLSEGFMAKVRYVVSFVLFCAHSRLTVTVCFLQLTVCYTYISRLVMDETAMVAMLGLGLIWSWTSVTSGLGAG